MTKKNNVFSACRRLFYYGFIIYIISGIQARGADLPDSPVLWLQADRGVESSGNGRITAWLDQSAQKNIAVPENAKTAPILRKNELNDKPVVTFDGMNDALRLQKELSLGQNFAAFIVASNTFQASAGKENRPVIAGLDAFLPNGTTYGFGYINSNHKFRVSNGTTKEDFTIITHDQYDVISVSVTQGKRNTYNFEEKLSRGELKFKGTHTPSLYIIGGGAKNSGNYRGSIAEIIIYNRSLTTSEQEDVRRYLLEKYFSGTKAAMKDPALLQKISFNGNNLKVIQVDALDRVFPDRLPKAKNFSEPSGTPRNGAVFFQFALISKSDLQCDIKLDAVKTTDGIPFAGNLKIYQAKPVMVEANSQGHEWNVPGGKVPDGWMKHLVRKAPFYINEALWPIDSLKLESGIVYSLVVEAQVQNTTKPGIYTGQLIINIKDDKKITAPFAFRVFKTTLTADSRLNSTHWMTYQPTELCSGNPPKWWSERHWELIEHAGKVLIQYGDNVMLTYLTENRWYGENSPLVKAIINEDGTFSFDFTRFDKWAEMFYGMGYKYLAGSHLVRTRYSTYVYDGKTGKKLRLLDCFTGSQAEKEKLWLEKFMKPFTAELYRHLKQKGWNNKYIQYVYDEPKDADLYKALADIVRTNMPDIQTADANNSTPEKYSALMDILVFNLVNILNNRELVEQRIKAGKTTWLYHCVSPYPPYPNRHLDSFLAESRLWPWLCFSTKATGFLYWAANTYQGVNEYESSLGPKGRQKYGTKVYMGYEPGDNWFLYRTPDGLVPSMRLIAHKAGTIDYALLKMVSAKDPEFAGKLEKRIVNGVIKMTKPLPENWRWFRFPEQVNYMKKAYTLEPEDYHKARNEILKRLEEIQP